VRLGLAHPNRARHLRVLLTEGSSLSSRETVWALGLAGHEIEVCDPDSWCLDRFSRYVRRIHRSPRFGADPEGYLGFVLDLLRRGGHDVLLPVHEQVLLFAKVRDIVPPSVGIAVSSFAAVSTLLSKVSFSRLLASLGLPAPPTRLVRTRAELEEPRRLPFYLKTAIGTATSGVWRVDSAEALSAALGALEDRGLPDGVTELVLQEVASGTLEAAQALFDRGRLIAFHAYRSLSPGARGGLTVREGVRRPQVREHCEALGASLGWHGCLNIDYLLDPEGQPAYIDANPRLVEPMNAFFSGVNLPDLLVRLSAGERLEPVEGTEGARTRQTLLGLLAAAAAGRGAVLRELGRAILGGGVYKGSREGLTPVWHDPLSAVPVAVTLALLLVNPGNSAKLSDEAVRRYAITPEAVNRIAMMAPKPQLRRG
jgi:predicted ATP-grasp superfamily ATP-dependent carboligase